MGATPWARSNPSIRRSAVGCFREARVGVRALSQPLPVADSRLCAQDGAPPRLDLMDAVIASPPIVSGQLAPHAKPSGPSWGGFSGNVSGPSNVDPLPVRYEVGGIISTFYILSRNFT